MDAEDVVTINPYTMRFIANKWRVQRRQLRLNGHWLLSSKPKLVRPLWKPSEDAKLKSAVKKRVQSVAVCQVVSLRPVRLNRALTVIAPSKQR